MMPQGLLVTNERGDEFLLATRSTTRPSGSDLIVSQKVRNQWVVLDRKHAEDARDRLMGALLEFFAGLCRSLNERIGRQGAGLPADRKVTGSGSANQGTRAIRESRSQERKHR